MRYEEPERTLSWQAPPRETPGYQIAGWFGDLVAQGDSWVQSQPGIANLTNDIQLLMGTGQDRDMPSNLLQPDIRSFIETITDLRQIATMGSKAKQAKKTVALYNDVLKFVFWDSLYVPNTRKALQWAMLGRGYKWQKFSRPWHNGGMAKIKFEPLGPREFLPDQLPHNGDLDDAYAGTIVFPMGLAEAHARFPHFQQWLTPISQYSRNNVHITPNMLRRYEFYDRWRFGVSSNSDWIDKYGEIRYHFVHDLRINDTGHMQQMGVDGTTWGYQVPSLGDLIITINPANGLPQSRKAEMEDCRMYPQLRLVVTSPSCPIPLYDDTAYDWHGMIPVTQHDVNDWVWSPMGYSIVSGVRGLEVARRDRLSEINAVQAIRKDPPLGSDVSTGVSRTQMDKLDLLHAQGVRIGGKGDPSKWTKSLLPESMVIEKIDLEVVEANGAAIKAALGLTDVSSMREVKGNMSDESFDKMIENLGPVAKGIALNQWIANSKDADMLKYNIPQYFSVDYIMGMIGPEGVGLETFDNDPNTLIPSHLPGEDTGNQSAHSRRDRAKWYCERIKVINTPAQLLNVTHMQERMVNMMFLQKGIQISTAGVMEKIGVPDYEVQHAKWEQEQLADAITKLEQQKTVQEKMKELGLLPAPQPGPGQGAGGGRPNVNKTEHHAEPKGAHGGDVRVVNSTSK